MSLTFEKFSEYNQDRCRNSFGEEPGRYPPTLWALGLCGEAGELAQEIKRLEDTRRVMSSLDLENEPSEVRRAYEDREKHLTENIKREIGDILPYLDMLAVSMGTTLEACTVWKFNEVSDRRKSTIKIPIPA